MTHAEAEDIAEGVKFSLPITARHRLKAIHVITRLHDGMVTIRCYFKNESPADPSPYIFNAEEL